MTPLPPGAPDAARAPSPQVLPTWRDLPPEPPYGPVTTPRTANLGVPAPAAPVAADTPISPGQIALAVVGTLVLVGVVIGAALFLLDDDDEVAQAPPTDEVEPVDPDALAPFPGLDPVQPQPGPAPSEGQLEPRNPRGGDGSSEGEAPEGGAEGDGGAEGGDGGSDATPPADAPQEGSPPAQPAPPLDAPAPVPTAAPDEEAAAADDEVLPRLFRLRTLPSGTAEEGTTVQRTERGEEETTEQVTELSSEQGTISVRATRVDDAEERLDALVGDSAEEVSIRGVQGWLIDGQRLVWLLDGAEPTLLEIDAPPAVGADPMLTIAGGLELLR